MFKVKNIVIGSNSLKKLHAINKHNSMIYLASPYTHTDKDMRDHRWLAITDVAVQLINKGFHVFEPITESHCYTNMGVEGFTWDFWEEHDKMMLDRCDVLCVVMLDGWDESVGVAGEIEYAQGIGMPIVYLSVDEEFSDA